MVGDERDESVKEVAEFKADPETDVYTDGCIECTLSRSLYGDTYRDGARKKQTRARAKQLSNMHDSYGSEESEHGPRTIDRKVGTCEQKGTMNTSGDQNTNKIEGRDGTDMER